MIIREQARSCPSPSLPSSPCSSSSSLNIQREIWDPTCLSLPPSLPHTYTPYRPPLFSHKQHAPLSSLNVRFHPSFPSSSSVSICPLFISPGCTAWFSIAGLSCGASSKIGGEREGGGGEEGMNIWKQCLITKEGGRKMETRGRRQ